MSEHAKAIVTAWFRDQWPGSTNLNPHVDGDYKKLTKHIARALAELERHQAEAAKAIHELRSALTAAAVEIHFQHRVGISSMIECPEARCREWCALLDRTSSGALQRAREQGKEPIT